MFSWGFRLIILYLDYLLLDLESLYYLSLFNSGDRFITCLNYSLTFLCLMFFFHYMWCNIQQGHALAQKRRNFDVAGLATGVYLEEVDSISGEAHGSQQRTYPSSTFLGFAG